MKSPLNGGILSRRYNATLHGRSLYRRKDVPGHNVIRGYNTPGTGDALDIFAPAGTPVFAMHDGKVSRIADPGGRLSCIYLVGDGVLTVYAHLSLKWWVKLWKSVKAGTCIGYVGRRLEHPHLHLEVWTNGVVVSDATPHGLAYRIADLIKPRRFA